MRVGVALLVVAWSGVAGLAGGAEKWIEVESPNFTVVSNAGEATARRTANEFEQVRAAYAKVWPWAHFAVGRPMIVLALRNERTLKKWAPAYYEVKGGIEVSSGWAHGADRVYLLLRTDYRPSNIQVTPAFNLYRAYVQLLLANSFERRLPQWLSNGLSEVFGSARGSRPRQDQGPRGLHSGRRPRVDERLHLLSGAQLAWQPQADVPTLAQVQRRLERAIEVNGSFANAYSYLAEVILEQGDGEGALAPAQRAVALEPGESYHRIVLARVLHQLGQNDEARKSAGLGLQAAADDAERSNAERFLRFLNEDVRHAQEQAKHEAFQKQTEACEGATPQPARTSSRSWSGTAARSRPGPACT